MHKPLRRSPRFQEQENEAASSEADSLAASFEALQLTTDIVAESEIKEITSAKSSPSTEEEEALYKKQGKSGSRISFGGGMMLAADRGRTIIGPQGEHVSAYCLYEELAYISCEGLSREESIRSIKENFGKLALGKKGLDELEAIASKIGGDETGDLISREDRKLLTRTLRGINYLCEVKEELSKIGKALPADKQEYLSNALGRIEPISDIGKIKEALKLGNRAMLSSIVSQMLDVCIWRANKLEYVSFPVEGLGENPNSGSERKAKDRLRLLSDFLENREDMLENKKQMAKLKEVWGINKDAPASLDELLDDANFEKVSAYIGKLFYYPWLEKDRVIDSDSDEWKKIVIEKHYNKAALPRDNAVEKLYQVTARHVVLIFNCFKGLGQLSVDSQQEIIDNFLNDLIEREGWKNEGVELAGFKKSLERYAILSYVEGQFMVNDKTDEAKELIR